MIFDPRQLSPAILSQLENFELRARCSVLALFIVAAATSAAVADEKIERRRAALLEQMRLLAEQTEISYADGAAKPELVKSPVFRYDDQPRRFIDATMWVWTDGGRPVAFQKIEAMIHRVTGEAQWGYCFTSVSEGKVAIRWSESRNYRSTEAGINFQPLEGAPDVFEKESQRKRQARDLAKGFAARVVIDP